MPVAFTRWFSTDKDGSPSRKGWYEVLFSNDKKPDGTTRYWDGRRRWLMAERGSISVFGLGDTRGERWRGLTAPAK